MCLKFLPFSLFVILAMPLLATSNCLPKLDELKLPSKTFSCQYDTDCVSVKEACRSCQNISVNKKYEEKFNQLDAKVRALKNCVLSCEACSLQFNKPSCKKNICVTTTFQK